MNTEQEIEAIKKLWGCPVVWQIGDDLYASHPLMFHWALLVNPDPQGLGYEDRFCYKTPDLIKLAISELRVTGRLRYWHKHHTKGHSLNGNLLFPEGACQDYPEQAIGKVDWHSERLGIAHRTCPDCGMTTHHPLDIQFEFCANCRKGDIDDAQA